MEPEIISSPPINTQSACFGARNKSSVDSAMLPDGMATPPTSSGIKAAILIQKWYRRYRKRLQARRECAWAVFQTMEYDSEQNQLRLNTFFNEMIHQLRDVQSLDKLAALQNPCKTTVSEDKIFKELLMNLPNVEKDYTGPRFTYPLESIQIQEAAKLFARNEILHYNYLCELLINVRNKLKTFGNVRHANSSIAGKITVCGDLHGNLEDLLNIFYKNGSPSAKNPYVFNGDMVDRGKHSIEVCVVLFAYFLMHPNEVFLNRGNHEDRVMNIRYGFTEEITKKYPTGDGQTITRLFEIVFSWLPIATVIDNKILVLHGGITDTTDFEFLSSIDRHKYVSLLKPAMYEGFTKETPLEAKQRKQISDLLWSDPRDEPGCCPNEYRGGGCYYGPDTTKKLLNQYKYELLIRSHECKMEGYEYTHNGLVLTMFSASNYYGPGTNRGAFLKLTGSELDRHFIQYMSPKRGYKKKRTLEENVIELENSAIESLWEKIASVKSDLLEEFKKYDKRKTGKIKPYHWFLSMHDIIGIDVSWRTLIDKMAICDHDGLVLYMTTFDRYEQDVPKKKVTDKVTEQMLRYKDSLETIFRMIDRDSSGYITTKEFHDAFSILSQHITLSVQYDELSQLIDSMDANKDGRIDFNEFLHSFRVHASKSQFTSPSKKGKRAIKTK